MKSVMKTIIFWTRVTLINLAIVALLGLTLRSKMIFTIPFIDFKQILHAHSHFAFGGWVTLALLALLAYKLLPVQLYSKPVYTWILAGITFNAYGMLFAFAMQGYAFFSILFSTLFILVSYVFTVVFVKDIFKTGLKKEVKILATGAVVYMALSSVGAFTLAYLLATKAQNLYLYKDAVYTYLHLQYNGFFTLAIFALMLHYLNINGKHTKWFAWLLNVSVIPSMFMSYLWHYPGDGIRIIAVAGSLLTCASLLCFFTMLWSIKSSTNLLKSSTKIIGGIAMTAFAFKMLSQSLTILPSLGELVFFSRPIIIGFLHLVLLGFVSLFLIAYYIETGLLSYQKAGAAVWILITGIILNELVLFGQGLGFIMMMSSSLTNWLLLAAALCLFTGALLIAYSNISFRNSFQFKDNRHMKNFKSFSQL